MLFIFPDQDKRKPKNDAAGGQPQTSKAGGVRTSNKQLRAKQQSPGRIGCIIGLIIIAATVLPIFFFVIAPMTGMFNLFGEDTRPVPGDATKFDPVASFAEIAAYARGEAEWVEFIEMTALYVKSDGTLDLTASYTPSVTYEFVIPSERPDDAPPIGAGGSASDIYYRTVTIRAITPGQMRSVTRSGDGVSTSYTYRHEGLSREVGDARPRRDAALPDPVCSLKSLWDTAIERREIPRDAVAVIRYEDGEYSFNISDLSVYLDFNAECRLLE